MRFYAVSTTAIDHTHRALQSLPQCRGGHGPSRALRVAQLYGHLQWRANDDGSVQLRLQELAQSWHLQPSQLRADLRDLQTLGWLRFQRCGNGTVIQLSGPHAPTTPHSGATPTTSGATTTPCGTTGSGATGSALLASFAEHYNRHRPPSWPAYSPRSSSLQGRLQQAVAHAGSPEALWSLLHQALNAMPPFWRDTYPQGRSASDCVAVLLSTGRQNLGLGVEFWHLFRWSSSARGGGGAAAGQGSEGTAGAGELEKARLLLVWDGHHWRGQGVAALHLPRSEKLRLALLLEDAGEGQPGAAMAQYGAVEA